jgi:two-component system sensor histidine kinase/response regulator
MSKMDRSLQHDSAELRQLLRRLSWMVPAVVVALLVGLAVAFYHLRAKPMALERAQTLQREVAERLGVQVNDLTSQTEQTMLTMRGWAMQGLINADNPAAFNRVLIPVMAQRPLISSVHLASDDGREVLLLRTPQGWKNRITHVSVKGRQQRWLSWLDATTQSGEEWLEQDYDPRKRPWFVEAMTTPENQVHWTRPYIFQTTQEPGITATLRWTDAGSGLQRVVAFDVLLADLSRLSLDMGYAEHGQVAVLTAENQVLGLPRNAGFDTAEVVKKAVLQEPSAIGLTVLAQALALAREQPASILGVPVAHEGQLWRVQLRPLAMKNQNFQLAMMAPESDFAPWSRQFWWTISALLVLLAGAGVAAGARLYRQVAMPIGQVFERLSEGNLALAQQSEQAQFLASLSGQLQQAQDFAALGTALLLGLSKQVPLGQGSFYLADEAGQRLILGSAYAAAGSLPPVVDYGQGLLGQCAIERRSVEVEHTAAEYFGISTALAHTTPQALLLQPVMNKGALLGAFELALLSPLTAAHRGLIDSVLPMLALCMEILQRNVKTQQLLTQTQQQAADLERQTTLLAEQTRALQAQQEAIRQSEDRMRRLLDLSPVGCSIATAQGVSVFRNQRLAAMLGYTLEQLETVNAAEYWVDPEDRLRFVEQLKVKGRVDGFKSYCKRPDGSRFTALLTASFEQVFGGEHIVSWSYDITPLEEAEEGLRRAKDAAEEAGQTFQTLFNASSTAHVIINAQAQIVACNTALLSLLDYAEISDIAGKHPAQLAPELQANGRTSLDMGNDMVGLAIKNGRQTYDWLCQDRHGVPIPVEVTIVPVMMHGQPHLMAMWHDLRSRLAIERQLRESKEAAEEATRAKSDFLANMSHEIRTPMNAIIGMSHLALQSNLDRKQRNYIEKVHRSGENLLGIINDILDFSKIEAGKLNMERINFHLEDVMAHLASLVGMKAEDKGLELLFDISPQVPTHLMGDPLRLGQVLINLGNNAVKFTESGEIVVGVDLIAEHTDAVELHFRVRDSGIGMTSEQCGKLFQSFSQADASTTRKYGGTGLGLVISKNLVELMDGRIWVESEVGKGSCFHFHARFGVQTDPRAKRMFTIDELQGARVLVVDDNAAAREILCSMVTTFGLQVDAARDGVEALRQITERDQQGKPYDVVLMDWKMPVMDGVETAHRLLGEPLVHMPKVVMVTAFGREEAISRAQERGVILANVLIKPITASTLLEAIAETLHPDLQVQTRVEQRADDQHQHIQSLAGARLLLVEDNDMNQELAMELLGQAGIQVVLAVNGQDALDKLHVDPHFDGVLMDCQMPVMDGYTASREIRKNPGFKDLPIIAMTANAMAGDRDKVLAAGMWDHIAKPLNVGAMFATLGKWIKPTPNRSALVAVDLNEPIIRVATSDEQGSTNGIMGIRVAATTPDSVAGLPELPGVDTAAGLATTMNNAKLYTRMLVKFRDTQGNFAALFAAARQEPDATAATRAAHTLKGTAGNIGAKAVQAAAGALEHACLSAASASDVDALLLETLEALDQIMPGLHSIDGAARPAPAPSALPEPDQHKLDAQMQRLIELLKESDSDALDALDVVQELARGTSLALTLKRVANALANFDFDQALAELQKTD